MCWIDKINYLVGHCTVDWIAEVNRIMSVRAVRLADDPPGYTDDFIRFGCNWVDYRYHPVFGGSPSRQPYP